MLYILRRHGSFSDCFSGYAQGEVIVVLPILVTVLIYYLSHLIGKYIMSLCTCPVSCSRRNVEYTDQDHSKGEMHRP